MPCMLTDPFVSNLFGHSYVNNYFL